MSRGGEQGGSQQSATDAEFRASFSLLPHVNSILAGLGQSDHLAVGKTVSTVNIELVLVLGGVWCTVQEVGELETALRRCQQLLTNCPYLDLSEEQQKRLLERKKKLLQEKR